MDTPVERISQSESPFIKGIGFDQNGNPTEEQVKGDGMNSLVLTPIKSNQILASLPPIPLPAGYNKNIGTFESLLTQELYHANYNSNGNHGIYVIGGNDSSWSTVIVDPLLGFTDDQEAFMQDHRWMLRTISDSDGNILEKFLLVTDGNSWHKWINVIAAIATGGFNSSAFPYWTLQPPHFDRRELLEWVPRQIMQNPIATAIPNQPSDASKPNLIIDKGFQFAVLPNYTDGRYPPLSPYSLPVIIKAEDYLNNPDVISKNIQVTMCAGSCMTESIDLYVRQTSAQSSASASEVTWGAWYKYIRLYKYSGCGDNSPSVVGTNYWLRQNPWANNGYDPVQNTITYIFDNSVLADIPSIDTGLLYNKMPLKSQSLFALGDAAGLADNLYDYDNLPCETMGNIAFQVQEKSAGQCSVPIRKVRLYAYIGRADDTFTYLSQVGWYNGANDTQMRWGTLSPSGNTLINFSVTQAKEFGLDFADHSAFVCYAKGTPYFAVGTWYQVNSDNSYVKLNDLLDMSDNDVRLYVQTVLQTQGYFMCVFDFEIPAGRYDFCIGRHNVNLTADFRSASTYVEGIANSRVKTNVGGDTIALRPIAPFNCIVSNSKEMEIDCTSGDVDVWGNGHDMFYIYCPYPTQQGNKKFRFIEGYLLESPDEPIGVEMFPYALNVGADDTGTYTDKNGFYFAYEKRNDSDTANIVVTARLKCQYPVSFVIPTSGGGSGWKVNGNAYLSDHNKGTVGDCNRVIVTGKITDATGAIPYSNISVSIADGSTAYTQSDGTFTLIVHNGQNNDRTSNIYVSAAGNFLITIANCGHVPLIGYNEALVPCSNCAVRQYPIPINLQVGIQGGTQYSLKENGAYSCGIAIADLGGRMGYVNVAQNAAVPSFLSRQDTLATYFQMLIKGALNLPSDAAWIAPYISSQLGILRYVQWVGDSIKYIDNGGNVVDDPATAVFASIAIDSLYNYNIANNLSLLSTYQFVPGDRVRILDDGNGNLLTGTPIDLQVYGENYNQAAMNANLVPNTQTSPTINNTINNTNTINTSTGTTSTTSAATTQNNTSISLYVRYDQRLDQLQNSTGFWIEIYAPSQQTQQPLFNELQWMPVINGEAAIFNGYANGQPSYSYPTFINVGFWDTYLFYRNIAIPNSGSKYLPHPFESPNISDNFGYQVTSGGRQWQKNDNAKQLWYGADVNKSGNLVTSGLVNGIGLFKDGDRKDFSQYPWGRIVGAIAQRSYIFFICEYNYFSTDYQFHYAYANEQGVMVTNLDEGLSTPHQKIGQQYGCALEDTGTIVAFDGWVTWFDSVNSAWVISDYRNAKDITFFDPSKGVAGGLDNYTNNKVKFIKQWNLTAPASSRFDIIAGVDMEKENIYLTFRPRKNNSNNPLSYVNQRRAVDYSQPETICYSTVTNRFTRFENFAPESYGKLRGGSTGTQMVTFAAGLPYLHNNNISSYLNFFGIQTFPVVDAVFNQDLETIKIFGNVAVDSNTNGLWVDQARTTDPNSFTYIPFNLFSKRQNVYYGALLRNMWSFFAPGVKNNTRSTLQDGKTINGQYLVARFNGDKNNPGAYFEIKAFFALVAASTFNKK